MYPFLSSDYYLPGYLFIEEVMMYDDNRINIITNNNVLFYKYSGPPKYGLGIVDQVFVKRGFLMYLNLYLFKFTRDS